MTDTIKKRRYGPLPTGKGAQVVVRLQPPMLALVDEWVKAYPLFRTLDRALPRTDRGYSDGEREALLALSRATSRAAECHRPARNMW